ncbi:potassium-transporting ATPase subunit C [Pseudonocardiaceae bacterium YIM PH 21723]|nr:potassium-transporting ATPase subunit C [Pseudonocardiaceae bacterium YIM PH 21723]
MYNIWRQTIAGLRFLLVMTVLLGVLYPAAVWGVSRLPGLHAKAEGSIVYQNGTPVGSRLIGVDLVDERAAGDSTRDRFFHTRPTGDPSTSGGSNLAGDSEALAKTIGERRQAIATREQVAESRIPVDAVTADFSGLDPHISPDYAALQAKRVARNNHLPEAEVQKLITENTSGRTLGFLGEPTVNVLELNLAIQRAITHQ